MKALTICQPFAELILRGEKRVENRNWKPTEAGPILIHAGKSSEWLTLNDRGTVDLKYGIAVAEMEFGSIVGMADVVDCVYRHHQKGFSPATIKKHPWLLEHRHASGPYCWILANVVRFTEPIPYRGNQGLWPFNGELPAVVTK